MATQVDKQTNFDIPAKTEDKRSRRQEAEDELKAAAATLNNAMSKISQIVQIPETLTLEHVGGHIDDVEGTAKEIANAIDKFTEDRQLKLSPGSKAVWKTCVKRWYMAAFPYIAPCLDAANVILLLRFLPCADQVPQKIVSPVSPYGVVIGGVLFVLKVL
jgi:hypothetical protein